MRLAGWWALLLVPIVPLASRQIDEATPDGRGRAPAVWPARHVRRLAPGFDLLMADLYWLRTVQYFGQQRAFAAEKDFALVEPLVQVTTDLDPRMQIAYRYGAIFLAEEEGAGDPDAAIALLRKGVEKNPGDWRLRQDLGFYHFLYKDDALAAGPPRRGAARIPGAPYWLETLAASVLLRSGEREMSREIWSRLYEQADAPVIRENARRYLLNLAALDEIDRLNAAITAYRDRHGRPPARLSDLPGAGTPAVPVQDPAGQPFRYDPETGEVAVQRGSPAYVPLR